MVKRDVKFKGVISDLDGVLVNTVPTHFKAWKRMFSEHGRKFTFKDYKEKVDGIPRMDGARAVLYNLSPDELLKAADRKQKYYLDYIDKEGVTVYKTSVALLKDLKAHGIKIAVISASKNCGFILKKTGINKIINTKVDGNDIKKGKPDPEVFLKALGKLKLKKYECAVFEDAYLGVEAAKRAGIFTVGIDRYNNPKRLKRADVIVRDLREMKYGKLKECLEG
ncbi:MAG: beta-phosphoglucomutase family hydrolase [Candidatus Omnitrophica bacterium]|nr:beta-phosphoglucomutase family hydrolase [Candidatus Omnitrophota bacterium]MCG2705290.1 beta-phosphoglucomutase family hydrolase [Candidatus Omnitrophota bacterium]